MARSLVRFDPFSGLEALRRDLFDDGFLRALRGPNLPTTDVYTEDDKTLIVEAHLPNFDENDISVNVDDGQLILQAERHEKEEDSKKKYVVRESSTSFYRSIPLPEHAQQENITAEFDKGLLKVTVPLAQAATPRKIAISGGG